MSAEFIVSCPGHDQHNGSTDTADIAESVPLDGHDLEAALPDCPSWCRLEPGHPDAVDLPLSRHRSTPRLLTPAYGGGRADRTGRATIGLQIEQPFTGRTPARIMLAIEINGDEHYAELTPSESRSLRDDLDRLLEEVG